MVSIGLNISGGEFGGSGGTHNYQYHYPTFAELQFYSNHGVDLIRLPFRWERVQESLGGNLDVSGDLALIKQVLANAAALGMDVILDNHNYGRYNGIALGAIGGPTSADLADFWKKIAIELKDYPALAGYDLMNEPHSLPASVSWKQIAQAATDAIRSVDMENIIYVEGTGWSGAHSWMKFNADLIINDPANKIIYQAHQYFDRDSSGKYLNSYDEEGAYPTVGVDRLKPFVDWLEANNLKGMIGEFGVPSDDPRWLEVQKNTLDYMLAHNLGGTAWGGGTWWSSSYSMFTSEPGATDSSYMDLLEKYFGKYVDPFVQNTPVPPAVVIADAAASEADGSMIFTVTRTGDLSAVSSVKFETSDGSALAGSDYVPSSGTLYFAAGQAIATIKVSLINDSAVEGNEQFSVILSPVSNVSVTDGAGQGTLTSEDVAPPISGAIMGTDAGETLYGTAGVDTIQGNGGNDVLYGRGAADRMSGGRGSDRFVFESAGSAHKDVVTDFTTGADKLDLRDIDANTLLKGNQKFSWLDEGAFTHSAGQLREYQLDGKHYVAGDVNGDGVADFTIEVAGTTNLSLTDIFL